MRAKQPSFVPLRHLWKPAALLFLRAEKIDRRHRERTLHGGERAQAAVTAFELLHDEPGGDTPQPGTAVAFDRWTKGTELRQLRHQIHRECAGPIVLRHDGQKAFVHPMAHALPNPALVGRQ